MHKHTTPTAIMSEGERIRQMRTRKQSHVNKWQYGSFPGAPITPGRLTMASVKLGPLWECRIEMPIPGSVYTKSQCIYLINRTTTKGTPERAKLIDFLAKNEFVPSKTGLYTVLRKDETGIPIKDIEDDSWGILEENQGQHLQPRPLVHLPSVGGTDVFDLHYFLRVIKSSPPIVKERQLIRNIADYDREYVHDNVIDRKGWKGRLRFPLYEARFCDKDNLHVMTSAEYSFKMVMMGRDVCKYIGAYDYDVPWQERVQCLYFDPLSFPPPIDIQNGGNSDAFCRLKTYIGVISNAEGCPVKCSNGKNKKNHNKVFICKKNKSGRRKTCPFSFIVSWDEHGYFIHLLSSSKTRWFACGCPWHCCK